MDVNQPNMMQKKVLGNIYIFVYYMNTMIYIKADSSKSPFGFSANTCLIILPWKKQTKKQNKNKQQTTTKNRSQL